MFESTTPRPPAELVEAYFGTPEDLTDARDILDRVAPKGFVICLVGDDAPTLEGTRSGLSSALLRLLQEGAS
jgi:hypothetical protein